MNYYNILSCKNREEFRYWLSQNSGSQKECWIELKRGRPNDNDHFWYLDAVEEALCFGWIDSTVKSIDNKRMQRFSPRQINSPWSELNKERVRRLEKLGLMTESGRAVLPDMNPKSFKISEEIETSLKTARAWTKFRRFNPLYQRIRAYNVEFYKNRDKDSYYKALNHLVQMTKEGKMYGEWNDYGRLLEY